MNATKTAIPRGEERFVIVNGSAKGCLWNGLYQFQGTVFWKVRSVVLGVEEWRTVQDADRLEMVKGAELLYSISGDDARAHGSVIDTPNGPRYAIPLDRWTP